MSSDTPQHPVPPPLPDEGALSEQQTMPAVPFRLWEPLAVFLFAFMTQALVLVAVAAVTKGDAEKAATVVAFEAVLAGWTILWARVAHQRGVEVLGVRRENVRSDISFGLGAGALAWLASTLIVGNIVVRIVDAVSKKEIESPDQLDYSSPGALILAVTAFGVIVVAPIAEELFFRGFVFGAFRRRLRFVPAAVFSSALFMIAHVPFWLIFPSIFTLGVFLAWMYQKRGTLIPCIVAHALFNAIGFAAYLAST